MKEMLSSAFCFSLFGIIALIGNLVFLPVILLRLHKLKSVQNLSRDLVFVSWRFFLVLGHLSGKFNYNALRLDTKNLKSALIIANHPSLLDVVFMLGNLRRINCVVKSELTRNIFLFGAIKASGYISNSDNESLLNDSLNALRSGENLLIFPEGTRTTDKISFHKAAFYVAINGAKRLYPLFIKLDKYCLKRGSKWYETPNMNFNFVMNDYIDIQNYEKTKQNPIRVRKLYQNMQDLYKKEFDNER
ncbi:MAG: 1-acyl-sn-glycerol-3-phosphate acyltransferase [Campylobacter sp.]|nr:1-acyl-sn-glycerol-3-phosphate acyltransferase [Campylobacter sp.]